MNSALIWKQIFVLFVVAGNFVQCCEIITIQACQKVLPYTTTSFPNYLGHTSADEASTKFANTIEVFEALGCHELSTFFFCTLTTPKCTRFRERVPPCRELCLDVVQSCFLYMVLSGLEINCDMFPSQMIEPQCISTSMLVTPTPKLTTSLVQLLTSTQTSITQRRTTTLPIFTTMLSEATTISTTMYEENSTDSNFTTVQVDISKTLPPRRPSTYPTIKYTKETRITPKLQNPTNNAIEGSHNSFDFEDPTKNEDGTSDVNNASGGEDALNSDSTAGTMTPVIIGLSIGVLVTMVTLVMMCVCFKFYNKSKAPSTRPENINSFGGFYSNPAFEDLQGNNVSHIASYGNLQGRYTVDSSQTNTHISAELAVTQLPPHPAALPPHKVLQNTGSFPYQEDGSYYSTINSNFTNQKQSKRDSNGNTDRNLKQMHGTDDVHTTNDSVQIMDEGGISSKDLIFANPGAKYVDINTNEELSEIDLTDSAGKKTDFMGERDRESDRSASENVDSVKKPLEHGNSMIDDMSTRET